MRLNKKGSYFSNPVYLEASTAIHRNSLNKRMAPKVFRFLKLSSLILASIAMAGVAYWYIN